MPLLLEIPLDLVLFFGVTFGLAWPLTVRLRLDPLEQLVVTSALSLVGVFLFTWLCFVLHWPALLLWVLPGAATVGLACHGAALRALWRDPAARNLIVAQFLVSAWCVGWLGLITSYSGGGWAGDWFEHWERTRFFLEQGPLNQKFLGTYPLAARPPLANVVTAAFLRLARADFAHYQFVSTLLAGLAFLPAGLLVRRWGGGRSALAVLAALLMVNPLFVQNATFAWTKLPAAFFVLAALYFFLRARDDNDRRTSLVLCATLLGAGLITHYSAGPYAVMLALAWLALKPRRHDLAWWRDTGLAALAGAAVLATWFGWSLATYGMHETLLSNSSVTSGDVHQGSQPVKIALNLYDTLVPHFFRTFDPALIAQRSPWGWWRDFFFQTYQLNLPLACGSIAWLAILRELLRAARGAALRARIFWIGFVAGVVLLGVATHGQRDHWGLTHISLQALVVLGVAFLAARWDGLSRAWRLALISGAAVDFILGIALQFAVQNYALDRWLAAGRSVEDTFTSYNATALMNLAAKLQHGVVFFGDALGLPAAVLAGGVGLLLLVALRRTRGFAD